MIRATLSLVLLALALPLAAAADPQTLRVLTWTDYIPADLAEDFRKETGIRIEVTLTNNEDIISRLRASNGAGFDLVHPSHDRVAGAQEQYGIYKPLDMRRIETDRLLPEMLEATRKNTSGAQRVSPSTRAAPASAITPTCAARNSRARPPSAPCAPC